MANQMQLLIAFFLTLIGLFGVYRHYKHARENGLTRRAWFYQWLADFSQELLGAAIITFLILFFVVPQQKEDRKQELVRLMSSADNFVARVASEELFFLYEDGHARWDQTLARRDFSHADWSDIDLWQATLLGSDFSRANLSGTNLFLADLTDAIITDNTIFSEQTILPDNSFWSVDTDITRFTNPIHENYWNACQTDVAPPYCF